MDKLADIYVISLERGGRWSAQEAMLKQLGLAAHRWPAIDGRATGLKELETKWVAEGVLKPDSNIVNCTDRPESYKQGVIGLMASTALLWRHLAVQSAEWTLILEDDCQLHPALADAEYVDAMWSRLPEDAEFVYLGCPLTLPTVDHVRPYVGQREAITAFCEDVNPFWVRMRKPIFGAYAYVVRRRVLPKLLAMFPMISAIDNFLPTELVMYAAKGPADWWHQLSRRDHGHVFWGMAAPCPGDSTISDT